MDMKIYQFAGSDWIKTPTGRYKVQFILNFDIAYEEVQVLDCNHIPCHHNGLVKGKCLSEAEFKINSEFYAKA